MNKIKAIRQIELFLPDSWSSSTVSGRFFLETDPSLWEDPNFEKMILKPISINGKTYFKITKIWEDEDE